MSPIRHFDHVGITVRDLDTVTAFFVGLGFETEGGTVLEGEFLDTVIGIPNSRTEIVMLRPPDEGKPGWNCRASSTQTTNEVRPTPCRTNWGCAT
jgi:catechol 2,3-dioxygenase-like lactoylglutathione lyase family enzyme